MKCLNNLIKVKFDRSDVIKLGDLELIRPAVWEEKDKEGNIKYGEDGTQKMGFNTDLRETKPQLCTVVVANDNYPYKVGDRLFLHYMAYECAQDGDAATNEAYVFSEYVFFTILPSGELQTADNTYLGEAVIYGEEVTTSGIVSSLGRKDSMKVNITHIPSNVPKWSGEPVNVGDLVVSIDRYNYEFEYGGKKMVRLLRNEIAVILEEID